MSAPVHTVLGVLQFLTKNGMTPMPHPPYSPGLTSSDFFLFPWKKKVLKGKEEEVKQEIAEALKSTRIDEFKNCFEQWKKCLNRHFASNEEYFEGD